LPPGNRA
jgi:hypothetical protein